LNVEWFVSLADARQKLRSSANITITNGRTALWRIERQQHSRSCTGLSLKKLVHQWGARNPHEIRRIVLLMLRNFSLDWYRKAARVNQPRTYIEIGTMNGGTSGARQVEREAIGGEGARFAAACREVMKVSDARAIESPLHLRLL